MTAAVPASTGSGGTRVLGVAALLASATALLFGSVLGAPDHVQFGFFTGSALRDPDGLLRGEGKFVRHIKVRKRSDIDETAFATLLRQAVK